MTLRVRVCHSRFLLLLHCKNKGFFVMKLNFSNHCACTVQCVTTIPFHLCMCIFRPGIKSFHYHRFCRLIKFDSRGWFRTCVKKSINKFSQGFLVEFRQLRLVSILSANSELRNLIVNLIANTWKKEG